ncbi:MAG: EamA family transporter [Thermoleophilia bacterium]|nr:EamA family transporter [Thermoleophilia bacterium]
MLSATTPARPIVVLALAVTWFVWGSTFVAIKVATQTIPPFLLMGTRFVVAGSIALAIAYATTARSARPDRQHWKDASVVGALLIAISMGTAGWAATRLDTGVEALLIASGPLIIALLAMVGGVAPARAALTGLAVGLVGVGLIVLPSSGTANPVDPLAALLLIASNFGWAFASLFAAKRASPGILFASGMQMLIGGALLLAASLAAGELRGFDFAAIDAQAAASWVFLVVLGSLGGFLAYTWLLEHVSTTIASTHAFVNPLVAVALGAMLLGEPFASRTALAGGAIVIAVVLLMFGARRPTAVPVLTAETGLPLELVPELTPAHAAMPRPARAAARGPRHAPSRAPSRTGGWSPAPTPAFARRAPRPWQATDGMDALAIDDALDQQL